MKFFDSKKGQLGLMLTLSVLVGCNAKEEFFATQSFISGPDAYCAEATTAAACLERSDACQSAYEPAVGSENYHFANCIANPDEWDPSTGGVDGGGEDGGAEGGTDGGTDGSTAGGSDGGSSGGTDGGTAGGSSGGSEGDADEDSPPTVGDAYRSKCKGLPPEFMFVKKDVQNGKTIKVEKKVKVCHQTAKSEHTIIIACPALKAHVNHHDDYLGACLPK